MRIYKTYFAKDDTPYNQWWQKHRKYHVVWKHFAYKAFLGHRVVKIKKYGLFTIYDVTKGGAE